ncbi:MAG: ADP-glyceromanno-heptose 6-epimerase [Chitinophagaceae bacterium]|nr:ADP-glyceromanno-heptose 6-epimerase [Chitinophagaceae bacterium]
MNLSSDKTPGGNDNREACIVVTGAAGFIGSCLVGFLNEKGYENLILVDEFSTEAKVPNLEGKRYSSKIEREHFFEWVFNSNLKIDFIFHLGARTDTTEFDYAVHQHLNVEYSQKIWDYCTVQNIPLVYASSAATYGAGEWGYADDHQLPGQLKPLNPYGVSKNEFDKWVLHQINHPPFWAGLKFFNVYGPNESHKGRMASVIWHSYNQIKKEGTVKLFRSHRPEYKDGQQLRDFVYVKDVVNVCYWLMESASEITEPVAAELRPETSSADSPTETDFPSEPGAARVDSGLYNLGTGQARTFEDLVRATFKGVDTEPKIEFIDMPEDIRDKYQYFTEARMDKLREAGYPHAFYSLEDGVVDYVRNYLAVGKYY